MECYLGGVKEHLTRKVTFESRPKELREYEGM